VDLADFIDQNRAEILQAWDAYARTVLPATDGFTAVQLRDDADALLAAIAVDMRTSQSAAEQKAKSEGKRPYSAARARTNPAHSHAGDRLHQGFDLDQMISEYRALRASVIRLWTSRMGEADRGALDQLTRFNEAIDEALADSVERYTAEVDRARELLLGALGHDLRNPLGAVLLSATYLLRDEALDAAARGAAQRIVSSARRMSRLVDDLLDFTRTRLGQPLPLAVEPMSLAAVCEEVVREVETTHRGAVVQVLSKEDRQGTWDRGRVAQLLSNLVGNAVEHGAAFGPVSVELSGDAQEARIVVRNSGPPIPESLRARIFQPMVHGSDRVRAASSVGLGLYIARQIVDAHGGDISFESTPAGTSFAVRLPRHRRQQEPS
jgi:signal transduction histidine kinase